MQQTHSPSSRVQYHFKGILVDHSAPVTYHATFVNQ